jgi:hypothetical protein
MSELLSDICCVSLPRELLGALATVRDVPGVEVALAGKRAWVRWEAGDVRMVRAVLPINGAELFVVRAGQWYRYGQHLPAFDFPRNADYWPLSQVLTPAPFRTDLPEFEPQPAALTLVADCRPRPATALCCEVEPLAAWADTVPAARLTELRAARCDERLLLLGTRLPALASSQRFWGTNVLTPLGYRADPDLPAEAIRAAIGIAGDELLLLDGTQVEVIATSAFRPLSRAQLRLALQEVAQ